MYSTEIANFIGTMQKLNTNEFMLYSVVLLQGCGLMYKIVTWRLGCIKSRKKKETPLDQVVIVGETKKHSITTE